MNWLRTRRAEHCFSPLLRGGHDSGAEPVRTRRPRRYPRVVNRRALIAFATLAALLTGCVPTNPAGSPSPSPSALDFTRPGVAQSMVQQLLTQAGSQRALMVEVTTSTVQVSVLKDHQPLTWAYRDGTAAKVTSDLAYVDQATFDVTGFNLGDVGALFRAAAGQSGSSSSQSLTIVDYSAGEVMMSVSTEPESRTIFFSPKGALMEVLDFETVGGISRGLEDVIGAQSVVYSVAVVSDQNVSAEFPGTNSTTIRRTRAAKVPAITTVRSGSGDLVLFAPSRINPAAIWRVVEQVRGTGEVASQANWSLTIDNRDKLSLPRMYFAFGFKVVVADLSGNIVSS